MMSRSCTTQQQVTPGRTGKEQYTTGCPKEGHQPEQLMKRRSTDWRSMRDVLCCPTNVFWTMPSTIRGSAELADVKADCWDNVAGRQDPIDSLPVTEGGASNSLFP
jgi:hypothetical protein